MALGGVSLIPGADGIDHRLHFFASQFGVHGQREHTCRRTLAVPERPHNARALAPGVSLLLMDGDGVMRQRRDALRIEISLQVVAMIGLDHVQVIDVPVAGQLVRQLERSAGKALVVLLGVGAPLVAPLVESLQLDAEDRGVQIVQAAVEPSA